MISARPGTIVVYADIACPWAHVAVYRLWKTRERLHLEDAVTFEHRAFPLELFNERPTPKWILDAEIPVAGGLEPGAGWKTWRRPDYEYPGSTLLALEAVRAATDLSARGGERLARALRVGMFGENRNVTMRHEILEIAASCDGVDVAALTDALDDGRFRRRVIEDKKEAESSGVKGSPHLFLADGTESHNPGIEMRWERSKGGGFPVVESDHPEIYDELLTRAAEGRGDG